MNENIMKYKDYSASVYFSDEDNLFVGRLAGIRHIVTFHGSSVKELRKAFKEAVDDYLGFCKQEGITPQRPYPGRLMLRIEPALHAKIAAKAESESISVNRLIRQVLEHSF